jgi:hypothetical protein
LTLVLKAAPERVAETCGRRSSGVPRVDVVDRRSEVAAADIFSHGHDSHICILEVAERRDGGFVLVCGEAVSPTGVAGPDTMDNLRPIHAEPCHREKTLAEAGRARGALHT